MSMTTIKVPIALRERISLQARNRGVTAATVLAEAIDDLERKERWRAVQGAYAKLTAAHDYQREFQEWDVTLADGLPGE